MTAPAARIRSHGSLVSICAQIRRAGALSRPLHVPHSALVVNHRQQLGAVAEERAAQHLQQAGCVIVARNFRCRLGELDIVARHGPVLVVAEMRLRTHSNFADAASSVTYAKRVRIIRATRFLLIRRPHLAMLNVRFDALLLSAADGPIDWIEGAFD
jgi:putative endonuclease